MNEQEEALNDLLERLRIPDRKNPDAYTPGGMIDYPVSLDWWQHYARKGLCPFPPDYLLHKDEPQLRVTDIKLIKENTELRLQVRQLVAQNAKLRQQLISKDHLDVTKNRPPETRPKKRQLRTLD